MLTTEWTEARELYEVTIDGESVRGLLCFAASEEAGAIECWFHARSASGGIVLYPDQDGAFRSYTRYGTVVITPPSPDVLEDRTIRLMRLRELIGGS